MLSIRPWQETKILIITSTIEVKTKYTILSFLKSQTISQLPIIGPESQVLTFDFQLEPAGLAYNTKHMGDTSTSSYLYFTEITQSLSFTNTSLPKKSWELLIWFFIIPWTTANEILQGPTKQQLELSKLC